MLVKSVDVASEKSERMSVESEGIYPSPPEYVLCFCFGWIEICSRRYEAIDSPMEERREKDDHDCPIVELFSLFRPSSDDTDIEGFLLSRIPTGCEVRRFHHGGDVWLIRHDAKRTLFSLFINLFNHLRTRKDQISLQSRDVSKSESDPRRKTCRYVHRPLFALSVCASHGCIQTISVDIRGVEDATSRIH